MCGPFGRLLTAERERVQLHIGGKSDSLRRPVKTRSATELAGVRAARGADVTAVKSFSQPSPSLIGATGTTRAKALPATGFAGQTASTTTKSAARSGRPRAGFRSESMPSGPNMTSLYRTPRGLVRFGFDGAGGNARSPSIARGGELYGSSQCHIARWCVVRVGDVGDVACQTGRRRGHDFSIWTAAAGRRFGHLCARTIRNRRRLPVRPA